MISRHEWIVFYQRRFECTYKHVLVLSHFAGPTCVHALLKDLHACLAQRRVCLHALAQQSGCHLVCWLVFDHKMICSTSPSARPHVHTHNTYPQTTRAHQVLPLDQSPLCACANDRVVELSADSAEPLESAVGLLADHLKGHPAQERPGGISLALADAIKAAAARGGENGAQQGGGSGEDQQG